ncbi:MAG: hypothetical protein ABII88_02665 [Candidatus Omnitrophota bacterium]
MNWTNIYNFLSHPLINLIIYIAIIIPLVASVMQYKKDKKQYKRIIIGFLLILLSRMAQNFVHHAFPNPERTITNIALSIIIVAMAIVGAILVICTSLKNIKQIKS